MSYSDNRQMEKLLRSMDFSEGHRDNVMRKIRMRLQAGGSGEIGMDDLDLVAGGFSGPFYPDDEDR